MKSTLFPFPRYVHISCLRVTRVDSSAGINGGNSCIQSCNQVYSEVSTCSSSLSETDHLLVWLVRTQLVWEHLNSYLLPRTAIMPHCNMAETIGGGDLSLYVCRIVCECVPWRFRLCFSSFIHCLRLAMTPLTWASRTLSVRLFFAPDPEAYILSIPMNAVYIIWRQLMKRSGGLLLVNARYEETFWPTGPSVRAWLHM